MVANATKVSTPFADLNISTDPPLENALLFDPAARCTRASFNRTTPQRQLKKSISTVVSVVPLSEMNAHQIVIPAPHG